MSRASRLLAPLLFISAVFLGGCGSDSGSTVDQRAEAGQARQARIEVRREAAATRRALMRAAKRRAATRARLATQRKVEAEARRAAIAEEKAEVQAIAEEAAEAESTSECDPNYSGACLTTAASDYDCEGGSGDGPGYTGTVSVVGEDHFGLDSDSDGIGCESE
jgi:membrane protein involved in colicin uptake